MNPLDGSSSEGKVKSGTPLKRTSITSDQNTSASNTKYASSKLMSNPSCSTIVRHGHSPQAWKNP